MASKKKTAKKAAKKGTAKKVSARKANGANGKDASLVWFGKLCADKRKERGWTQTELANHAQCCAAWVGSVERGAAAPSASIAAALMKSLKFTRDEKAAVKERIAFKDRRAAA